MDELRLEVISSRRRSMLSRKRGAGNLRPLNLLIPPYSHARPCPSSSWLLPAFFQGPINARLRVAVDSPVLSAAISFLSGGLLLLCIMATGAFRGTGAGLRGMLSAPLWAYVGGALGVSFVLGSIVATPQSRCRRCHLRCDSRSNGRLLSCRLVRLVRSREGAVQSLRLAGIGLLVLGVLLVQRK